MTDLKGNHGIGTKRGQAWWRNVPFSRGRMLILLIIVSIPIYWLGKTIIPLPLFLEPGVVQGIFPGGYDLFHSLLGSSLILGFGVYALHLINKQQRVRRTLEQVVTRNQLILDSAGEGIFGLDVEGKVTFVNAAAARISGYEVQDLMGQNIHEILHYQKLNGTPHPREECPIFATLRNGEVRQVTDDYFWNREGKSFPVEYASAALKEKGRIVGAVAVFRDITERKRAEAELREAKDFLENVFENSADCIAFVDQHGKFTHWNKAAEKIYGFSFEELKGKLAFDLYADPEELEKMLAQLRRDGLVRRYEIKMRKKDGHIAPFALSINYLFNHEGNKMGSICVARDRTDIKQAMTELEAVNEQLRKEILERQQVEQALKEAKDKLEGLVGEFEQRNRDMTLLNELGDLLQACLTRDEAYGAIAQFGGKLFPDDTGTLFVLNPSQNLLEAAAHWGEAPAGEPVFTPDDCWAFRRSEAHKTTAAQPGLRCRHLPASSVTDHWCIPMMAQGETMGLLHLQSHLCRLVSLPPAAQTYLAESKERLAVTLAKQISLALASLNLRESLRWQAIRDPLTGLFNRRYMEESLEREVLRVKRRGASLGVIMMDLDHFKRFNDTFGHKAGDAMLSGLADVLKNHTRREDIACRYGGEELLVILPETPLEITLERAELLREAVSQLRLDYLGQSLGAITISLGVAAFPEHGSMGEELIGAADAALYRAKKKGRNRVVVAGG